MMMTLLLTDDDDDYIVQKLRMTLTQLLAG